MRSWQTWRRRRRKAIFNWFRKPIADRGEPELWWQGDGVYGFDIVGESHYQDALSEICGGRTKNGHRLERVASLAHISDNRYDRRAIGVFIEAKLVGYLSKYDAGECYQFLADRRLLDAIVRSSAVIVGGWDRGHGDVGSFGVKLDMTLPYTLLERKT